MPELWAAEKAGGCAGRYLTAIAIGRRVSKGKWKMEIYSSDRLPVRRAHHILTRVFANAKNAVIVQMIIVIIIHGNLRIYRPPKHFSSSSISRSAIASIALSSTSGSSSVGDGRVLGAVLCQHRSTKISK